MKIDSAPQTAPTSDDKDSKEPFRKVLDRTARPKPKAAPVRGRLVPGAKLTAGLRAVQASSQALASHLAEGVKSDRARSHTLKASCAESRHASSERADSRTEGVRGLERQVKARVAELLSRELGPLPAAVHAPTGTEPRPPLDERADERAAQEIGAAGSNAEKAQAPDAAPAAEPVSSVMALVEKVEVFVRSQKPTLSLSLGGELSGQVEIEKVGPGKVALRWTGANPKDPGAPDRIRRALASRGLSVTRLQLG